MVLNVFVCLVDFHECLLFVNNFTSFNEFSARLSTYLDILGMLPLFISCFRFSAIPVSLRSVTQRLLSRVIIVMIVI